MKSLIDHEKLEIISSFSKDDLLRLKQCSNRVSQCDSEQEKNAGKINSLIESSNFSEKQNADLCTEINKI